MSGVRRRVTIIGPGARGLVRASYRQSSDDTVVIDVPSEHLPPNLRLPNATFVALVVGRDLVGVETNGEAWLEIQDRVRAVLNQQWDPIGVADVVDDEYDGYIGEIYALLKSDSSEAELAEYLRSVEADKMELRVSPIEKLRAVAHSLRRLDLPNVRPSKQRST